mgnify:CR=1 FL=1
MTLTRSFRETIIDRAKTDPAFRLALLEEAADCEREGDLLSAHSLVMNWLDAVRDEVRTADLDRSVRMRQHRQISTEASNGKPNQSASG